jgi:hypothetical protein
MGVGEEMKGWGAARSGWVRSLTSGSRGRAAALPQGVEREWCGVVEREGRRA